MKLFVNGDEQIGYWVELGHEHPILTDNGEFTAVFMEPSSGLQETVSRWRAERFIQTKDAVRLEGGITLSSLNAHVKVYVTYQVINAHVVKKEVAFTADTDLFYSLSTRLGTTVEPEQYWTFEHASHPGGPIYEIYPAMGMTIGGHAYGFLTDSGYRNRWTRIIRQTDGKGFLVALEKQPDAELMMVANEAERASGIHYVQYKFGEYIDFTDAEYHLIQIAPESGWQPLSSGAQLSVSAESVHVHGKDGKEKGIGLPLTLDKNELYEVYFEYKSKHPLSVRLLDATDDTYFEWAKEMGAWMDNIPATEGEEWKSFAKRLFSARFPNMHQLLTLKIMQDANVNEPYDIEVRNMEIRKYIGKVKQFHTLTPGEERTVRLFVFEEPSGEHRDLQVASQVRLAEGLGFDGTEAEKNLFADNQMLVWIAQHDKFAAHVVPSLNYHPDMYLRDTFWEVAAVFDRDVSVECWNRYAETQHPDGQLDTLVRAYRYAPSVDDNDSTMFFIMWAYLNWKRYGVQPEMEPLRKALANIRMLHCPNRDGVYRSRTAGWFDTIWGPPTVTAINQGHFAVVLQCAKALGLEDVSDEEIAFAKDAYRALYDAENKYVHWSINADYLSPSVLLGEFMNLWLFNEPILSDEAVIGTVEKLPIVKRGVPCIVDKDAQMFTEDNKPWEEKYTWRQGVYHNGGSWFLYEYLAYAAAARHGWAAAKERMNWRMEMEFSKEDEPYSHEFIPLTDDKDDWWPTCRMFGWNTFAIVANQIADGACEASLKNHVKGCQPAIQG